MYEFEEGMTMGFFARSNETSASLLRHCSLSKRIVGVLDGLVTDAD